MDTEDAGFRSDSSHLPGDSRRFTQKSDLPLLPRTHRNDSRLPDRLTEHHNELCDDAVPALLGSPRLGQVQGRQAQVLEMRKRTGNDD